MCRLSLNIQLQCCNSIRSGLQCGTARIIVSCVVHMGAGTCGSGCTNPAGARACVMVSVKNENSASVRIWCRICLPLLVAHNLDRQFDLCQFMASCHACSASDGHQWTLTTLTWTGQNLCMSPGRDPLAIRSIMNYGFIDAMPCMLLLVICSVCRGTDAASYWLPSLTISCHSKRHTYYQHDAADDTYTRPPWANWCLPA